MKISATEALHIAVSVVTISLAFSLFRDEGMFDPEFFLLIFITVGAGFVFHELGHKYMAIKYGLQAEYRAWTTGLFLALFLAFVTQGGFVFAAPGAVYIFGGHVTREQNGKISLAGPFVNLLLVIGFFALAAASDPHSFIARVGATGVFVNAFLGIFNLLPFHPLDGAKVMAWNKMIWASMFAVFGIILFAINII